MKKYSQDQENPYSDDTYEDGARLIIDCDTDGVISLSCEYAPDDIGMTCFSTILSAISCSDSGEKILNKISADCESEEEKEQLKKILFFYETIQKINKQTQPSNNDVVITPIEAAVMG